MSVIIPVPYANNPDTDSYIDKRFLVNTVLLYLHTVRANGTETDHGPVLPEYFSLLMVSVSYTVKMLVVNRGLTQSPLSNEVNRAVTVRKLIFIATSSKVFSFICWFSSLSITDKTGLFQDQ